MKKLLVSVIAGVMMLAMTGCGEDNGKKNQKTTGVEEIRIENIQVEEIKVEEIQIESVLTERTFIDDEYKSELEYNSRVNTWDNIPIQTF